MGIRQFDIFAHTHYKNYERAKRILKQIYNTETINNFTTITDTKNALHKQNQ